ncbi:conserved membrane hypothetical protein [Desulfosarcina cetonica]|uniref:CDP-alcohol phosphatidyltransferase family protein n=1 Tax=Desulfosarcina cetonica TaxID=90730 RepID=UPI0006D01D83|nr:CDP-alcohol phosphatidyltransferase family protein [Desulfosarcina cetonica]VTR69490.1 conserved membrane hypothetical protein [Desulfosarcina cetonica]
MPNTRTHTTINIPNLLTLSRLLLTPLFIILLLRGQLRPAVWVFVLAGISDGLDGLIARLFNQRTVLGAYLDPVADKALLISAYVCLAYLGIVPTWLSVIVLSRDILIVIGIAIFTITQKNYRIRPSLISKWTTGAQLVTVMIFLLAFELPAARLLLPMLVWIVAGLTVISGLHYIWIGMQILQQPED